VRIRPKQEEQRSSSVPTALFGAWFLLSLTSVLWASGFTAGMAKRDALGPFDAAPIVQGDPNDAYSLVDDLLTYSRGSQVTGNFYRNMDTAQGSVVLWWTPEYSSASLSGPGDHFIWYAGAPYSLAYEYDTDRFRFVAGGQSLTVGAALTAGTAYCLVARWDTRNSLDGTNYLALSINGATTYGATSQPAASAPDANLVLGSDGTTGASSGVIEGLTVYRRLLFDGTRGTDAANGNEIALMYNSGVGDDPSIVTGSWDVVFSLPTDSQRGALASGAGQAWSHPHQSNLIPGNTNRGGFMLAGAPATDGWSNEGAPSSVTPLAAADKIFDGGYQTTSSGADEGIRQDVAVGAGDDWVVRALAHSDGTCQPTVVLYDQTNLAEIGRLTGTTSSTRSQPDVLAFTGQAPAGAATLRVKLVNAAAAGTCYWHQVEVLASTVSNPSMETWQGTDPDIPVDWTDGGMEAGTPTRETTTVHSGTSAFRFNGGPDLDRAQYDPGLGTNGEFRAFGIFAYYVFGQAPFPAWGGSTVWYRQSSASQNFDLFLEADPGAWKQRMGVGRTDGAGDPTFYVGQFNSAGDFIIDDFYGFSLTAVSLSVTPASSTGSLENTSELRVDGRDIYVENGVGEMTTTAGLVSFSWRPRHSPAQAVSFAETTADDAYIAAFLGDANDYIQVYWDSVNTIRMRYSMNGTTATGTWNAGAVIVGGTKYSLEVAFTGGGSMTFKVDGITRITLAAIPAAFGTAANNVYYGSSFSGTLQGDATIDLNTTAVELRSFTAQGGDGAVALFWETASELDNLGFHLYRATAAEGVYERITALPIPGLGGSPVGARYSYRDAGRENGTTYFYKLEDIETSGRTEEHGPVAATPAASATGQEETLPDAARITYGNPEATSLRVLTRRQGGVTLELATGGFYAEPREDGSVRLLVPDFIETAAAGAPGIPVRQTWIEAVVGRQVRIATVRASGVVEFSGLRPSWAEAPELVAHAMGTAHAGTLRRRPRIALETPGLYPEEAARLVGAAFQGENKKAQIELAPLRWDAASRRLLLARRLVVEVAFSGREPSERLLDPRNLGRGHRHRESADHTDTPVIARLATREKGLYRVAFEDLFGRGRRSVATSSLRLSRLGRPVAYHVEPDDGVFGPRSTLFFVSEGESLNRYGPEVVYELAAAERTKMPVEPASPAGSPVRFFWHEESREENRYYQAGLLSAEDPWLWELLFAPSTKSFPFHVDGLASVAEPARLTLSLQGVSDEPTSPDHHVRVFANGAFLAETSWNGKEGRRIEAEIPPGLLEGGENVLAIENVGDTGAAYSSVMVDRFSVAYPRELQAESGGLEGRPGESGIAVASGLSPGSFFLDVTEDPPRWLRGIEFTPDAQSRFSVRAGRSYLALSPERALRPRVLAVSPSRLKSERNRADYLLIAPREFLGAAAPLLEHRRRQGLASRSVAVEDLFTEFGYGEARPEAILEFLSFAYHHWRPPAPRYVLLLGDATYDFKDYLRTGTSNRVPPLMVKTRYLWTASDPAYAMLNGDDSLPDVAIGRLPAATLDEASILIRKVLAYESREAPLSDPIVLVADNPDAAGNFEAQAEEIASELLAGHGLKKIYLRELGAAPARASVIAAFDQGASVMSYLGHGGIRLWASEGVFDNDAVSSLNVQPLQPLLLTMNCLNGYFHFPYFDSLAEKLLKSEGRGAVAAFSPTGLSQSAAAQRYHKAILKEILSGAHARLGDAVAAAQEAYLESGDSAELLGIYHLLGDPALSLR
jgi:hypothetical protein